MIIQFIIQLEGIERVQLLSMAYSFIIEFKLTSSTFMFEFIILIRTKLRLSELVDGNYIFTPQVKST